MGIIPFLSFPSGTGFHLREGSIYLLVQYAQKVWICVGRANKISLSAGLTKSFVNKSSLYKEIEHKDLLFQSLPQILDPVRRHCLEVVSLI